MRPPTLLLNTNNTTPDGPSAADSTETGKVKSPALAERDNNNQRNHHHQQHHHGHVTPRVEHHNETPDGVLAKYLAAGSQFADHYDVEHDLGKGRFAVVRRCRCRKSGSQYAAKVLRKARLHLTRDAIVQEVFIHHRAARVHPRIARLLQVFEAPRDLVLVLEYAAGGELWQALAHRGSGLHEPVVRRVLVQLLDLLAHIHANGIIHCDINPHNILLARPYYDHPDYQPDIRLCDFGLARTVTAGQELRDIRGTLEYVAPEVLLFDPIGPYSDMWSVGVLTYVLLSGYSPFAGATKEETLLNISRGSVSSLDSGYDGNCLFPDDEEADSGSEDNSTGQDSEASDEEKSTGSKWATAGARDFITKVLARNPKQRLTASECLRLPWLRDIDVHHVHPQRAEHLDSPSTSEKATFDLPTTHQPQTA